MLTPDRLRLVKGLIQLAIKEMDPEDNHDIHAIKEAIEDGLGEFVDTAFIPSTSKNDIDRVKFTNQDLTYLKNVSRLSTKQITTLARRNNVEALCKTYYFYQNQRMRAAQQLHSACIKYQAKAILLNQTGELQREYDALLQSDPESSHLKTLKQMIDFLNKFTDPKFKASAISIRDVNNIVNAFKREDEYTDTGIMLSADNFETMNRKEVELKQAIAKWCKNNADPTIAWATNNRGVAAISAAGLEALCDMDKAVTYGHLQSYAGFNPLMEWGAGKKRPFNNDLKKLCYNIGQNICKRKGVKSAMSYEDGKPRAITFYGLMYLSRKTYENQKNDRLEYKDQADAKLKRLGKGTVKVADEGDIKSQREYYAAGKLPPGHIDSRAVRWTIKLFLSHWWSVKYWYQNNEVPPVPYPAAHLGHVHIIPPPNCPFDYTKWGANVRSAEDIMGDPKYRDLVDLDEWKDFS